MSNLVRLNLIKITLLLWSISVLSAYGQESLNQKIKEIDVEKNISLNFQDMPVRTALQILAKVNGSNIVISDHVTSHISLHLEDVSWQEVLEVIAKTQGLVIDHHQSILLIRPIDDPLHLDDAAISEKKERSLHQRLIHLNYENVVDIATLLEGDKHFLLSNQGSVNIDEKSNNLFVEDHEQNLENVAIFVKQLDTPTKQVLIEAKIVRVSKDFARELGNRWGITSRIMGNEKVERSTLDGFNIDLPFGLVGTGIGSIGFTLANIVSNILLDLELAASESENQAKIIASPRLLTANRQSALIETGTEIPYQESTLSGATSVTFKKAVISLQVTPEVTADNHVRLDINVKHDSPDFSREVLGTPPINTQTVQSNILVEDGQTIVLGGIYQQDQSEEYEGFPFLGSIPLIGLLFQKKVISVSQEELLIFITPTILSDASKEWA